MKKQNLNDYLKSQLTMAQFEQLQKDLKISQTKFTRLLNDIDAWSAEHFKTIVISLDFKISPNELFFNLEIKTSITINEMQELSAWYESLTM